ncbi:MAG: RNHCP domain-containing protein [candidate division SR1 bacterium]|nr:RNHCP domain-containing protein [candidate division SR1 bacterium]
MKTINETFTCLNCGKEIPKAQKTCRNHCPFCFASKHVDGEIPGDRASECQGAMYPTSYEMKNSEIRILFSCSKCGKQHWNKRAIDDDITVLPEMIAKYRQFF